jgi:hypothetical protein
VADTAGKQYDNFGTGIEGELKLVLNSPASMRFVEARRPAMLRLEILVTFFVERLAAALVSRSSFRNGRWDSCSHPGHAMPQIPQKLSNLRITRGCPGLE